MKEELNSMYITTLIQLQLLHIHIYFLGRNKALRIEAPSPIIIRIKAGKRDVFFIFLANIAGASPSSAKFINTLVTANNEPTNVEKTR